MLRTTGQLVQAKKHQMSIPPELRVLNHQLSTVPTAQLPQITPLLLRNVLRCQGPLSSPSINAAKDGTSETSAVHTLKNHVSRLLHGKSAEGRFVAIILVKGIIDVGGWEVLREALPWVRGLLGILTVSKFTTILVQTNILVEARSCRVQEIMHHYIVQYIPHDAPVPEHCQRDHYTNPAYLSHVLPCPHFLKVYWQGIGSPSISDRIHTRRLLYVDAWTSCNFPAVCRPDQAGNESVCGTYLL